MSTYYSLGIDIGSTTVKIAILNEKGDVVFSDYERHLAHIQETLAELLIRAKKQLGTIDLHPVITGSGGLNLSGHMKVPFVQEVVAVATSRYICTNPHIIAYCYRQRDFKPLCTHFCINGVSQPSKRHNPVQ